jgi:[acyl-carrier-protein] S-malonyltransferase
MNELTAILCAGQGAQTVGMGRELAEGLPECQKIFAHANDVLGYDLQKIIFDGPETELTRSNHCQPAIFTVTVACFAALKNKLPDFSVTAAAGLSLGEWSALYLAGAVSFEEGLRVLEARGRFMQEACEEQEGSMLSIIGLGIVTLQEIAQQCGVEIANYNSTEQTVLSGRKQNILEADKIARSSGAKRTVILNVAGAYHSTLMKSAADKMNSFLSNIPIREPRIPVMSNFTGRVQGAPEDIRKNMVRQITSSVRWIDCVQNISRMSINCFVECGPGRVLSGLVKRIHPPAQLCNVQDNQSLKTTVAVLAAP